ncbi:hypothetical protein [Prochlorococcus sp. MIT 1223]|uniref:hypothetical protein n=1 Tax=Prochlorococcus sp. MIT 1223 TaxID=3096217 RepID=UPI002A7508C2|nr:hypothetical protein [Prochlorococcus sp. MIT 1223]
MSRFLIPSLLIPILPISPLMATQGLEKSSEISKDINKGIISNNFNKESTDEKVKENYTLEWKKHEKENKLPTMSIQWKPSGEKQDFKIIENQNPKKSLKEKFKIYIRKINKEYLEAKLLRLGNAVPTANRLNEGDIQLSVGQKSSISDADYAGGTGNQNYMAKIDLGLNDDMMLGFFYANSDDPLHASLDGYSEHPENRWIIYGASLSWQQYESKKIRISLNTSLENWNVKSGGCNQYRCTSTSPNIFNSNTSPVENNNIVGSISLPITWYLSRKFEITFAPKGVFLPDSQGNKNGNGKFYGNNFGLGLGVTYNPLTRVKIFSSAFLPIGSSQNSFDKYLTFKKEPIFSGGINYSLDSKISFEGTLTNGFGQSPATGILTLPSRNQILYSARLIYKPTNYSYSDDNFDSSNVDLGGLSVSTARIINKNQTRVRNTITSNNTWSSRIDWGSSEFFNFDIAIARINQNSDSSNPLIDKYHNPGELYIRGGGKISIFSQERGDLLSTSLRVSGGRLMGNGWVFAEMSNTYSFNTKTSLNINPKMSSSGNGNPVSLGSSIIWQLTPSIAFIPETNIALQESQSNWTFAIRLSPTYNTFIDLYTTNSLSFVDTGQMQKSDSQSYGFNFGTVF